MVRGCPENTRGVHQVAVVLNRDAQTPMLTVGQRSSGGCGRSITNPVATTRADESIVLVEIPKPLRPIAYEAGVRNERPVRTLDLSPEFGTESSGADWLRVPVDRRRISSLIEQPLAFCRERR